MKGSWVWMAVFSGVFVVLGLLDVTAGDRLGGVGLLVCGAGSALLAEGDRRSARGNGARSWRVLGSAVALVGLALLSWSVFGTG